MDPILPPSPCLALVVKINKEDPILNDLKCFQSLLAERGLAQEAILFYIRWQKYQIYIVPTKLLKYEYIYNIVKEAVTLNIKFRNPFTINQ